MRRHHRSPIASLFTTVAQILLLTVILAGLAEWVAKATLKAIREDRPIYMLSYTPDELSKLYDTDQPEHYREVLAEAWRMGETMYSAFVEYKMIPYQGKHFTITEDGYRSNGRPQDLAAPGPKVFVFGGSTTMGSGVDDGETIPAYLEEALRAAGKDAQVFNFGVVSYYSTQERIAFERMLTAGVRPDVVVFVDGLNDFYYCTIPDVSSWNERLIQTTRARARMPLGIEIANRSNVVQLARHLGGDKSVVVREWGSFCNSNHDVDKVIHRLDTNRRMIDAIGERLGVRTVFVQQPVPTYHYDNAKRPVPVQDEMLGYHINAKAGYPRMAEMKAAGQLWDRNLVWLAELEPAEGNAYVDTVHYSPRFNRAIAQAVAAHILDNALLP